MIDYSTHTAWWHHRVDQIQQALREKKYATALAKIADMQASLVEVDAWIQARQDQQCTARLG